MPLHPMIVHFPIALYTTFILLEIIWMLFKKEWIKNSAILILFLGLLFTVPTILSGEASAEHFEHIPELESLIESHETFAKLAGITFLIAFIIKIILVKTNKFNTTLNLIAIVISLIGFYFLINAGLKGGELVYKHGVGILY